MEGGFKIEAVKQVTERGYPVVERLGVGSHCLCAWIKRYGVPAALRSAHDRQADEIRGGEGRVASASS